MRRHVRSFLIGFAVVLAARRWAGMAGAVVGVVTFPLTTALTSPNVLGEASWFYTAAFAVLAASGFAGGRVLLRRSEARA